MSSNTKQNNLATNEVEKVDDAYLSALLLCFSRVFPAILNAAVDLNLFEIIAKLQNSNEHSSFSAYEIASQLPNQHPELAERLERMLTVLASYSLLTCSIRTNEDGNKERVYALSSIGQYFACDSDGGSLAPLSTLIHRGCNSVWGDAKDAILDPDVKNIFQSINGTSFYQYTKTNKELNDTCNKAMAHSGPLEIKRILQFYKGFEGVSTLVDVGGGVGKTLKLIISQYPSIKGINFDMPQVVQNAPSHPGLEHVGGDMFESVPTGDAIVLKLVCHNWADEECVKFLKNCHKALPKHGKVIVLDYIIPEVPNSSNMSKHACAIDNLMFLVTTGKERTEEEFESLCKRAGFSKFHVACSDASALSGVMASLMNARLVCKKWRSLTTTPRFLQLRREGLYQNPWLFLFGAVKDGFCSGEIHALDVSQNQWHRIEAGFLRGRFLFSVASVQDDIFIVGGCSSLTNFGKVDRSSFKTHRGVLSFSPLTKSWRKISAMKYARSIPILGVFEVSLDFPSSQSHQSRQDRRFPRSKIGGVSDVYEDPHKLSMRRHCRSTFNETEASSLSSRKAHKFMRQISDLSSSKSSRRFLLIAVGGLGSWDEPLDSGEIYDSISNKWTEIPRLPFDFGIACSGVVCGKMFYVYSETDKLAAYDIERGFWIAIQATPIPPRVHEYYPKLVSSKGRLFMLSVSWCEGDGQIGRRNKAVRKLWELDLMYLTWTEVSVHPDAPMDWNAVFVADKNLIFGVEMFKIFGQVLDFFTVCDVTDMSNWNHISRNHVTHELDGSSCVTKSVAVMHL